VILHTISVEGWRCFAEPLAIGPFSHRLNVIHGPNGIGKSTLVMALVRCLFDNHNVGGEAIQTLRPWGRQLTPKVTIEFEHDGVTYRLHKQFLDSPKAQLSRKEGSSFVPLAEGRAADEQARQLLAAEPPGKGPTKQQHWGLAQILWATQGHLPIESLSAGTQAAIRQALGAQVAGPGAHALERRIVEEYRRFFTSTGRLRSGKSAPELTRLDEELKAKRATLQELQGRLAEFEDTSSRIEDLRHKAEQAKHDEGELRQQLDKARKEEADYKRLKAEKDTHAAAVKAAEAEYNGLHKRLESIEQTERQLRQAREEAEQLEQESPAVAEQLKQCEQRLREARQKRDQARAERQQAQSACRKATAAERYLRERKRIQQLDELLAKVQQAEQQRDELRAERQQLVAPDEPTLRQIETSARRRDEARLQLDAAVITVRIEPEASGTVEVTAGEEPGTRPLEPGSTVTIKGTPDVALRLPGVARLEATGPTKDVEQLRSEWEQACQQFEELTAGFGTKELDELRGLHRQAAELERRIRDCNTKIDALLGGRSADEVQEERNRAEAVVAEILEQYPQWSETPPDEEQLARDAAELERRAGEAAAAADAEYDAAQKAQSAAQARKARHEEQLNNAKRKVTDLANQLESLRAGQSDEQLKAELTRYAMERDAAQAKLRDVERQLDRFEGDPTQLVKQLEGQLNAVREEADRARDELKTEEGRMQDLVNQAPYSALAKLQEEIAELEGRLEEQRLQVEAVRLLHEVLQQEKQAALDEVIVPVRRRAVLTLQRIAGSRFRDIAFGDSFVPQRIAPQALDQPIELAEISGGEQEQVHFAVRLALAEVAFPPQQRQLLVLDDVFTYTDTVRLARVATILEEAADRFQIMLLTCHPERYRSLPDAKFFDLEDMRRTG